MVKIRKNQQKWLDFMGACDHHHTGTVASSQRCDFKERIRMLHDLIVSNTKRMNGAVKYCLYARQMPARNALHAMVGTDLVLIGIVEKFEGRPGFSTGRTIDRRATGLCRCKPEKSVMPGTKTTNHNHQLIRR
jgi:hypothetical protein